MEMWYMIDAYGLDTHLGAYLYRHSYTYPDGLIGVVEVSLKPLQGFADASGDPTTPDEVILTVNGCLSTPELWQQFENVFQDYLKTTGFKPVEGIIEERYVFHTTDFKSGHDATAPDSLSRSDRERICTEIAIMIRDHTLYRFGFGIRLKDWDRFHADFPTAIRSSMGAYLSQCCFGDNSDWSYDNGFHHAPSYVFDQGDDFWGAMENDYRVHRKRIDPDRLTVSEMVEGDKRYSSPLQAADFVAWYARDYFRSCREAHILELASPRRPHRDLRILNVPGHSKIVLKRYKDLRETILEYFHKKMDEYEATVEPVWDLIGKDRLHPDVESFARATMNLGQELEEAEKKALRDKFFAQKQARREERERKKAAGNER